MISSRITALLKSIADGNIINAQHSNVTKENEYDCDKNVIDIPDTTTGDITITPTEMIDMREIATTGEEEDKYFKSRQRNDRKRLEIEQPKEEETNFFYKPSDVPIYFLSGIRRVMMSSIPVFAVENVIIHFATGIDDHLDHVGHRLKQVIFSYRRGSKYPPMHWVNKVGLRLKYSFDMGNMGNGVVENNISVSDLTFSNLESSSLWLIEQTLNDEDIIHNKRKGIYLAKETDNTILDNLFNEEYPDIELEEENICNEMMKDISIVDNGATLITARQSSSRITFELLLSCRTAEFKGNWNTSRGVSVTKVPSRLKANSSVVRNYIASHHGFDDVENRESLGNNTTNFMKKIAIGLENACGYNAISAKKNLDHVDDIEDITQYINFDRFKCLICNKCVKEYSAMTGLVLIEDDETTLNRLHVGTNGSMNPEELLQHSLSIIDTTSERLKLQCDRRLAVDQ